jgi:hypothetical protein
MDLSKYGTSSTATSSSGISSKNLQLIHAVAMFAAWGVFPYVAIYIARYLKDAWGHRWFQAHMGIMFYGVGILTIIGLVSIEIQVADGSQRFISSTHGILGTVVALVGFPLQVILGFVSDKLWSPDRVAIPVWDKVHWWLGRALVLLSAVTFYFGLSLYGADTWVYIAVYVIIALELGGLIMGQLKGGAVHHVAGKGNYERPARVTQPQ